MKFHFQRFQSFFHFYLWCHYYRKSVDFVKINISCTHAFHEQIHSKYVIQWFTLVCFDQYKFVFSLLPIWRASISACTCSSVWTFSALKVKQLNMIYLLQERRVFRTTPIFWVNLFYYIKLDETCVEYRTLNICWNIYKYWIFFASNLTQFLSDLIIVVGWNMFFINPADTILDDEIAQLFVIIFPCFNSFSFVFHLI